MFMYIHGSVHGKTVVQEDTHLISKYIYFQEG